MTGSKKYRRSLLKFVDGAGYFTVFIEWLWLLALCLPSIFESSIGKTIFPEPETPPAPEVVSVSDSFEPSFLFTLITIVVVVAVLLLICYILFAKYIPTAARATTKVAHMATEKAVPIIALKPLAEISVKKRRVLTGRVLFWTKIVLATAPLAGTVIVRFEEDSVESQLVILGFAVLCSFALVCFVVRSWLARRWRAPEKLSA